MEPRSLESHADNVRKIIIQLILNQPPKTGIGFALLEKFTAEYRRLRIAHPELKLGHEVYFFANHLGMYDVFKTKIEKQ